MENREKNKALPSMFPIEWINRSKGYFVIFSDAAIEKMLGYRQISIRKPEAGGILVGYRRPPHLEITDVSTPGMFDRRSRISFERLDEKHQRFARKCWRQSNGYIDYLGEWHTHPEQTPIPSCTDLRESLAIFNTYPRKPVLEVIVGTDGVWVGIAGKRKIDMLTAIQYIPDV